MTMSCFLATATIFSKCDRGNTEPQGFDGLFTTIARVFLSIKDSNCATSACQPRSGESTCVLRFSKFFFIYSRSCQTYVMLRRSTSSYRDRFVQRKSRTRYENVRTLVDQHGNGKIKCTRTSTRNDNIWRRVRCLRSTVSCRYCWSCSRSSRRMCVTVRLTFDYVGQ